jgi:hypothetical protein
MNNRLSGATWRKSSYSSGGGACVELAMLPDVAGVRDTKDRDGGALRFDRRAFAAFVTDLKEYRTGE